jgi:uncharacterized protein (DUF885 family)
MLNKSHAAYRYLWITALLVLGCSSCALDQGPVVKTDLTESQRFAEYLESVYQKTLAGNPELSTKLGTKDNSDKWNDLSIAKMEEDVRQNWHDLRTLHTNFDYSKLDPRSQLNYRAFETDLKLRIKRYSWRYHLNPINQIVGIHLEIPGLLTKSHMIENLQDAQAYLARIQSVGTPINQFIELLKERENRGFFLAKSLMPRLIGASESIISGGLEGDKDNNLLFADFKKKLSQLELDDAMKEKLIIELKLAIERQFVPAYQRLIQAFKDHQALNINDNGAWRLPDGDTFYQFLLRQFTTTDISADEVHSVGLQEVKRIHQEMNKIKNEVGFKGDLKSFFEHLKTDPQFYYPNTDKGREDYLEQANEFMGNAKKHVKDFLPVELEHDLVIRRIEAYREKSAPVGYYEAGTPEGSIPGTVFLGMYDMSGAAKYDLGALLSHEGIPGHHLQLSLLQSQQHIPNIRKYYVWWSNTAFTEGWALYAEYLAKEIGLYSDPYSEFGRLAGELWRACRLVVDSGLHAKRWSRQQAIDYLNENTSTSIENNIRAVDRYLAVPGQATAFKIGMMKILELREHVRTQLGKLFDIREFHYAVLKNGPIPLSLVEEEVQAWIENKQK